MSDEPKTCLEAGGMFPWDTYADMAAMLVELEWSGDFGLRCPVCDLKRGDGAHKDDCRLAALLKKVRP